MGRREKWPEKVGRREKAGRKCREEGHGKKYGIHRLRKPSVDFRKRGILLKFSRVFRS